MGLLEKALKYKSEMNKRGRETIIDRIPGPADTELMNDGEVNALETPTRDAQAFQKNIVSSKDASGEEIMQLDESLLHELDDEMLPREEAEARPIILDDEEPSVSEARERASDTRSEAESDDLFRLPEEDATSPEEVLGNQKYDQREIGAETTTSSSESAEAPITAGYQLFSDDPFGPEDAPVISGRKSRSVEISEEKPPSARPAITGISPVSEDKAAFGTPEDSVEVARDDEALQPQRRSKQFQDFLILYEIGKEIMRCDNRKDLFDAILFSVMGQIGTSSSSVLAVDTGDPSRWIVGDSRGVTIRNKKMSFDTSEGIISRVISRKQIVDLDEFKDNPAFSDDYYRFISIDARLLSPMVYDGEVIGAIVLGEKLTIGDYSDAEKDFIAAVSEISAIALRKVSFIEKLRDEHARYSTELEYINHVEELKARMVSDVNLRRLDEIIGTEFQKLGILSFAVFVDDEKNERYMPLFVEKNDTLALRSKEFVLPYENSLVEYIGALKECVKVEDHRRLKVVSDAFTETRMKMMPLLWIYPFKFGKKLSGFLLVFDIVDFEREKEIHGKLARLSTVLFSYIMNLKSLDVHENRYVDFIEPVLRRIENELQNARNLKIPLTIILFSIKNFKRYYTLYGRIEARRIIDALEMIIRTRLSDTDFSVRFDRNKVLIVLPGKNKKYAVPLANTVRNEIIQYFKQKEVQLLVTFLSAEFPEDGDDLYTLLDIID